MTKRYPVFLVHFKDRFFFDETQIQGSGTGFFWDRDGHIVTNYHVIHGADALEVRFGDQDDRGYRATIVGVEPDKDLAVLKVDAPDDLPPPLPIGCNAKVQQVRLSCAKGQHGVPDHLAILFAYP